MDRSQRLAGARTRTPVTPARRWWIGMKSGRRAVPGAAEQR